MKKILSAAIVVVLLCSFALAENVFVTVSDGQGSIVLANKEINVSDADDDGVISIYDVLYTAHETAFDGGAAAGFSASDQGYGMSIDKLWGEANGGSYGYYVNNASAYSLVDPVADGDHVQAFVYTDLVAWSDTYSFFNESNVNAAGEFELTLAAQGYDSDWNPVYTPVEGAVITIDGEASGFVTDVEGKAFITIAEAGEYLISAYCDGMVLVPPVCIAVIG